jgi:outer membrane cobalamin receptor
MNVGLGSQLIRTIVSFGAAFAAVSPARLVVAESNEVSADVAGAAIANGAMSRSVEDTLDDLSLSDLLSIKIAVASKSEDTLVEAPSSVTVLTQKDIQNLGVQSLQELLNYVAGYQVTRDIMQGDTDRISVRGRSTPLSEYVLVLIDGQRINDLYTGGANIMGRFIALEDVQQVEVIRGPGSAIYGSNAFEGVVNVITGRRANIARIQVGTQDARVGAATLGATSGPVTWTAFIKYFSDRGYEFNNVADVFNRTDSFKDPRSGMDARLSAKIQNLTLHFRQTERHMQDFVTFGTIQDRSSYETASQTAVNGQYDWKLSDRFSMNAFAGYAQSTWDQVVMNVPKGFELTPGVVLQEPLISGPYIQSYQLFSNVDFSAKIHTTNELMLGGSYEQARLTDVANLSNHDFSTLEYTGSIVAYRGAASFNQENTRRIGSVFVQDKQTIAGFLHLTVGARLDAYSDFGWSLNPRVSAVAGGPWGSTFRVSYATAFRAPTFLELYDRNNPVDFGNPSLKAENIQTIEGSYTQSSKWVSGTVTYYHNAIRDAIVLGAPVVDPINNPGDARQWMNGADKTTNQGGEVEVLAKPISGLSLRGTLSHLFNATDLPMPANTGSLILNYRLGRLNLNLSGIYRQKYAQLPTQDGYVILNANLLVQVVDHLRIQLAGYNLLNTHYQTLSPVMPVPNRGATGLLGLIGEL